MPVYGLLIPSHNLFLSSTNSYQYRFCIVYNPQHKWLELFNNQLDLDGIMPLLNLCAAYFKNLES